MIGNLFSSIARVGRGIKGGVKEADIKGFLTKQFGGSSIKQRALIGGGFFGAASLTGSYYDAVERQLSAYYGEEKYEEQYAAGVRTRKGMATFALNVQGFMGLLGRDFISRGINSARYLTGSKNKFMSLGTTTAPHSTNIRYTKRLSSKTGKMTVTGITPTSTTLARSTKVGLNPKYRGNYGDIPRLGLGSLAFGVGMATTEYTGVSPFAMGAAGAGVGALANTLLRGGKKFSKMTVGVKGDPARAREFGLVGKAGTKEESKFIKKRLLMTAGIMGGGFVAGGVQGSTRNASLPEGNIIDFSRHNESGVQRMNFSTAGLVQALHRSNSRY